MLYTHNKHTNVKLCLQCRPLPGRVNVVLSRGEVAGIHSSRGVLRDSNRASGNPQAAAQAPTGQPGHNDVHQCSSLDQALELLASPELREQVSWLNDAPGPFQKHVLLPPG